MQTTEQRRVILLILLAIIMAVLWQDWRTIHPKNVESQTIMSSQNVNDQRGDVDTTSVATVNSDNRISNLPMVSVQTDVLDIKIDPKGGNVVFASLPQYHESDTDKAPVVLMNTDTDNTYLAQSALVSGQGFNSQDLIFNTQATHYVLEQDLAEKFMTHINSAPFIEYFRAYPGAILMLIQSPKLYPLFKKIDDATLDKLLFQHPAHNRLYHYRLANLLIENVGIPQACEILMRFSAKPLSLAFSAYNFVPKGNIAYAAQTSSGPLPMLDVYQTINICYNRLFFLSCCCPDVLTFGHLLSTLELSSIQTDIARPYPIINDNYTKNTLVSVADANYGLFSYFYLLSCYFTAVTEKHEDYINQIKYSLWALLHDEKPTYTIQRATMPSLDEGLSIFIGNKYLQDILRNVLSNRLKNPLTSQEEKNLLHLIMADPVPSEDIFCDNGCVELDIFRA
jgi:hypothetical protein